MPDAKIPAEQILIMVWKKKYFAKSWGRREGVPFVNFLDVLRNNQYQMLNEKKAESLQMSSEPLFSLYVTVLVLCAFSDL